MGVNPYCRDCSAMQAQAIELTRPEGETEPEETKVRPVLAYINFVRWPSAIPAAPFGARFMTAVARAGVEAHYIVQSAARGFEGRGGDGLAVLKHEYGITPPDNLHIHVIPMPYWKPASDRLVFFTRVGRLLKKLVRSHGVNVVMSRDTRALPFLVKWRSIATRAKQGPPHLLAVHDSHNFYMDLSRRDDVDPSSKRLRRYQKLEQRCLPKLDGHLPLLDVQATLYREYLPGKPVTAAHPGLDEARPPDPERPAHKTVAYLGSLQGQKGVDLLVDAFRNADLPEAWRLLFIGGRDENEIASVQRKADEAGLGGRVEITGWLNDARMRAKLHDASLAVLPLRDTFYNQYLTAPSKLFDYLAHAIPVITSELLAVRELAQGAAMYVPPGDSASLADAIQRVASCEDTQRELAARAHERAKELLWDRRGEVTAGFLESLLTK